LKRSSFALALIGIAIIAGAVTLAVMDAGNGSTSLANNKPTKNSCGPALLTDRSAGYMSEYSTPSNCSSPNGITVDTSGKVWFVEQNMSMLAMFDPVAQNFTEYPLPVKQPISWGLTTTVDRSVWIVDANSSSVLRFHPQFGNFSVYKLGPGSYPMEVVTGPDGAIWFSELYGHRIGRIQPDNGLKMEFATPNNDTGPVGISFDLNHTLWIAMASFNQSVPNALATLDPANGTFHYYRMPVQIAQPTGIAVDDSGKVWIAEHGPSLLGRYDPLSGKFMQVATSAKEGAYSTLPYWLAKDSTGAIWFNEHYANRIARLDPANLTLTEYDIPSKVPAYGNISNALTIAVGPRDNVWFTELSTSKLGMVNTSRAADVSIAGPSSAELTSPDVTLRLNVTTIGRYAGPVSYEVTDSEQSSGALLAFSVNLKAQASSFPGLSLFTTFNATVSLNGNTPPPECYFTFTVREPGLASSKIVLVRLEPHP
jgi:virginiamycin B lyase